MCARYLADDYFVWPNMRYANVCDYLHRHRAMQLYAVSPSELLDRIPDSDTVYLLQTQLICEQSRDHSHLLRNSDLKEFHEFHHRYS